MRLAQGQNILMVQGTTGGSDLESSLTSHVIAESFQGSKHDHRAIEIDLLEVSVAAGPSLDSFFIRSLAMEEVTWSLGAYFNILTWKHFELPMQPLAASRFQRNCSNDGMPVIMSKVLVT